MTSGGGEVSALEAEAKKRRDRLAALKNKRRLIEDVESAGAEEKQQAAADDDVQNKRATFRSYVPQSDEIGERRTAASAEAVEQHIGEQLARAGDTRVAEEIDLSTLAPRKVDWDLKRDVQKKLDKLERRTQRAMAELIRERIASGETESLYESVRAAAEQPNRFSDDDDD